MKQASNDIRSLIRNILLEMESALAPGRTMNVEGLNQYLRDKGVFGHEDNILSIVEGQPTEKVLNDMTEYGIFHKIEMNAEALDAETMLGYYLQWNGLNLNPNEIYEAASIDGAGPIRKFITITLPLLSPVILFNLIMQIISGFMVFTQAFIVTGGAPLDTTLFYALYIYRRAFENFQMGYASALAWVLMLVIGIFAAVVFKTSSGWVFYENKDGN